METNFLKHDLLPEFLEILASFGQVHGPLLTDSRVPAFGTITTVTDLRLYYRRTLIPPKKYLLPPRETILIFDPERGFESPSPACPEIVLLGLHPCDLQGIAYLDRVFLGYAADPLYRARRQALTLIGLSCEPDEYCFCGEPAADGIRGCDLFMHSGAAGFDVRAWSPKGRAILDKLAPCLTKGDALPAAERTCGAAETIRQATARGEMFEKSPLWEKFAGLCLSCGACSLCCPTCYCFDIREQGALDGKTARRIREWDNCLFKTHGEVAGGVNFRKSRLERFHYRYRHKYLGFGPTRGMLSCVGCGRCREVCPVKIDLLELFGESENATES
ncbi:4Fe-4S dicluster domain-containing protein [Geobacter sp. SVR]|uniref:4Fe-4S dicluster domain-containing protein n=1 Tax=Geobacter sp. SVR TaxID=2495594 RepID=UPI00143EFFF5|nr:4Fe-4S dicluster domain-containing protein [Geobacter sp. SVR]BCS55766.1 hydrogenase [Geobacter sp. SVR]GCF83770.1 hydrogenase [Geobacter sp. SVR]